MAIKKGMGDYFRKRCKLERERRGWSQADMSKLLAEKKIGISTTAVAKLEAGTREVKIDEAAAIADTFGVSLDSLLGRTGGQSDKSHAMAVLAAEAARLIPAVTDMTEKVRQSYDDLQDEFGFSEISGHFPDLQQWILWLNGGTDEENMRAGLMWAGRDRMLGHLHAVITELAAISRYRSAPVTDLADDGEQRLDLFAAQWKAHAPEALGAEKKK